MRGEAETASVLVEDRNQVIGDDILICIFKDEIFEFDIKIFVDNIIN